MNTNPNPRYVVDGTDAAGQWAGDAQNPPFAVFDTEHQRAVATGFPTRADAANAAREMTTVDNLDLSIGAAAMTAVKAAIREPYAFPGGYEKFAICTDGGVLCHRCLKAEFKNVSHSTRLGHRDGWAVSAIDATCNIDGPVECDHCAAEISA